MADANTTVEPIVLNFPGPAARTYAIAPGASAYDVESLLEMRIANLDAMLAMISGEGTDALQMLSEELQRDYLFACSTLASEIRELNQAAHQMRVNERQKISD